RSCRMLGLRTTTLITRGTPVTNVTLTPGNQTDLYKFTVGAGQKVFVHSQGDPGGTGTWKLLDPFGNVVFGPTNLVTDIDTLTLNTGGTYILVVEGVIGNSSPVSYTFALQPTRS